MQNSISVNPNMKRPFQPTVVQAPQNMLYRYNLAEMTEGADLKKEILGNLNFNHTKKINDNSNRKVYDNIYIKLACIATLATTAYLVIKKGILKR